MSTDNRQIHQLVHTMSYGDAISGEVLALQRCFREFGFGSEIYAINVHPKYRHAARDYCELTDQFAGEVLLHYSLGSPLNELYCSMQQATRSMIYHNLTPADWFRGVNPRIVEHIEQGRRELPELCRVTDRLIADSQFNAQELTELGAAAEVLELPIDPEKWNVPPNPGLQELVASDPGVHLLHVGRLAPNKCVEDIIKVFYFLHHHIEKQSRLWLVGIDTDTELYSFGLKRLTMELKLDHAVNFTGCLADSEVKALYQASSVYMCMSEHEGFCLPVIEAMHFGMPVVAFASSALPDTVADGGVLVHHKKHAHIAEVVYRLYADPAFRNGVIDAGHARAAQLTYANFKRKVSGLFCVEAAQAAGAGG